MGPDASAPVLQKRLSEEKAAQHGTAFLGALESELCADPDSFGLRRTTRHSGRQLVDLLDSLDRQGVEALGSTDGAAPEERRTLFHERFAAEVAGLGRSTTDFVVRRAAVRSAERLLDGSPVLRHAVESGRGDGSGGVSDELFCAIYQWFFADAVAGLLEAVIVGHIQLTVPVLPMVDPTDSIVGWIADEIVSSIPTPCSEKEDKGYESSLVDLGRDLVGEAIERALGIPEVDQS